MTVILHVGMMKSATTYIQNMLFNNRALLEDKGWFYPGSLLNHQHAFYGLCGSNIPWVTQKMEKKHRARGEELKREIDGSGKNLMISAEALASLDPIGIEELLMHLPPPDLIVLTVRNLQKVVPSAWQQLIKGGGTKSLPEFVQLLGEQRGKGGFWRTYGFGQIVRNWSAHAPVRVVNTSSSSFKADTWKFFSQATGIDFLEPQEFSKKNSNESLSMELIENLRYMNILRYERKLTKSDIEEENNFYLKNIGFEAAAKGIGTKIALPPKFEAQVQHWQDEEMALVEKYASEWFGKSLNKSSEHALVQSYQQQWEMREIANQTLEMIELIKGKRNKSNLKLKRDLK